MLRLASDEHIAFAILRGLRQRHPDLDIVHVLEAGMQGAADPDVLAWSAAEGRILITCDRNTMIGFAYDRVRDGLPMTGLMARPSALPLGRAIDDILLLALATEPAEWLDRVEYLPL